LNELKVYLTHLYEGTMVNLLENLSFHLTTLESLDEYLLDLLYYIYENLVLLIKNGIKEAGNDKVIYDIGMSCLSILRYISDHIKHLSLSVI